ncbi:hypothetical protein ACIBG0_41495 [Nocardia sp. NPDC050630]|uniref:hypothetical protein n=1 Tax=Nocardia sp. NPDC050630 TaxID=3364321 RepID=UPI0037B20582
MSIDDGTHVRTSTPVDHGVRVRTEENWKGAQVEADVPTSTHLLGAGLESWLVDLRTAAEQSNTLPANTSRPHCADRPERTRRKDTTCRTTEYVPIMAVRWNAGCPASESDFRRLVE